MSTAIQELNDTARRELTIPEHMKSVPNKTVFTMNLMDAFKSDIPKIIDLVKNYDDFGDDDDLDDEGVSESDPHGEHDFGVIMHNDKKLFWKFDYYDKALKYGSENPADILTTTRVLTIMMASDY